MNTAAAPGIQLSPEAATQIASLCGGFERMVLHELQTGGGLAIDGIASCHPMAGAEGASLREIHILVEQLKRLRAQMFGYTARLLVERFDPKTVLDLGAGLAPWSVAIADRSVKCNVTAFDLPAQVPSLRSAVSRAGLADRVAIVAADFFGFDFSSLGEYDLVIVANVCHVLEARQVQFLFQCARSLLRPGGALAVIDQVLETQPDWRRSAALYVVGAPHWMPGGSLFTEGEYRQWIAEAGLTGFSIEAVCAPPAMMLITARR